MLKVLPAFLRITVVLALFASQDTLAAKYFCGGRELDAAGTARAEQLIAAMRKAMPAPAPGWIVSSTTDGGVDCGEAAQTVPANILFRRSYLYIGEAAAAAYSEQAAQADQARIGEHEGRLAGLKKEQEEVVAKYNAARATRDPKVLQPLQQKMRELQLAQAAGSRELAQLRNELQGKAQERRNAEWTASQTLQNKLAISLTANQGWFKALYPDGKKIEVPGVSLAVRDSRADGLVVTQLYFGRNQPQGADGTVTLDRTEPLLDVQNLAVRIEGAAQPSEQFLKAIDIAALQALVKP